MFCLKEISLTLFALFLLTSCSTAKVRRYEDHLFPEGVAQRINELANKESKDGPKQVRALLCSGSSPRYNPSFKFVMKLFTPYSDVSAEMLAEYQSKFIKIAKDAFGKNFFAYSYSGNLISPRDSCRANADILDGGCFRASYGIRIMDSENRSYIDIEKTKEGSFTTFGATGTGRILHFSLTAPDGKPLGDVYFKDVQYLVQTFTFLEKPWLNMNGGGVLPSSTRVKVASKEDGSLAYEVTLDMSEFCKEAVAAKDTLATPSNPQ